MRAKNLLILKASDDIELCEAELIERVASMYGMNVLPMEIKTEADLDRLRADPVSEWDIVYACGHGDHSGLGEPAGDRFFSWDGIAEALCTRLAIDAWFFLACCRGGLDRVAYAMFCGCDDLTYVFGPRWEATSQQLACAFHALVHNFVDRQVEPVRAAKRASKAIDLTIRAFDRGEVEASDAFQLWCASNGIGVPAHLAE